MKKFWVAVVLLITSVAVAKADVEFAYDAGAEVVSAYIWRGQYNGGLSFQPDLEIGYDGELTSFRAGVWGNIGASDWRFKKNAPTLEVKGGSIDKEVYDAAKIEAYSKVPGKKQLYAMLMSAMNGPVQKLAATLQAYVDKKTAEGAN